MSALLEIKDLYGGYEDGVSILQGINLTVDEGEAVGIIGLNGSGKSTLGKAIINQIPYRHGHILYEGHSVEEKSTSELAQLGIALMLQGGVVFPKLTVWQNLQIAIGNSRLTKFNSRLLELIPLFHKPKRELMRTMADKLSGGQRHELALAMTLARQPKLVILDEPSAGMSPKAVDEMYSMLQSIRDQFGLTLVLVEQNIMKAMSFCDRCIMMECGALKNYNVDNKNIIGLIFDTI